MKTETQSRTSLALGAISIAICIFLFYKNCIWTLYTNPDAGWLIQTGQYILQHGLPKEDPFSWTNPHCSVVCYQWLFEVAAAQLYNVGSLWLVGFVSCLLAGLLMLFILPRLWTNAGLPLFVPFAVMALVQTPNWFHARPQLVSYYLCLVFVLLLERFRRSQQWQWLAPLPILTLFWANVHLFWAFGLLTVCVYLICQWRRTKKLPVALTAILVISAATILINPYGLGLISYGISFLNGSQYANIWEIQPAWSSLEGACSEIILVAACLTIWRCRRRLPMEGLVLAAIMTAAAVLVRRFQPLAVITCWPFIGAALSTLDWSWLSLPSARPQILPLPRRMLIGVAAFAGVLIVTACCWYAQLPSLASAWMMYTEDSYPFLCALLKVTTADDRLFNNPTIGSWLIGMQQEPVFVDTRFDMYPRSFLADMDKCLNAQGDWHAILDEYCIDELVLRDGDPLNQKLMSDPNWVIVLHDGHFAWWNHNTDKSYATMRHWSLTDDLITQAGLPKWITDSTIETRAARYLLLARNYRQEHKLDLATDAANRGILLMPESKALHQELALSNREVTVTH
jgi:hypothetical protein